MTPPSLPGAGGCVGAGGYSRLSLHSLVNSKQYKAVTNHPASQPASHAAAATGFPGREGGRLGHSHALHAHWQNYNLEGALLSVICVLVGAYITHRYFISRSLFFSALGMSCLPVQVRDRVWGHVGVGTGRGLSADGSICGLRIRNRQEVEEVVLRLLLLTKTESCNTATAWPSPYENFLWDVLQNTCLTPLPCSLVPLWSFPLVRRSFSPAQVFSPDTRSHVLICGIYN